MSIPQVAPIRQWVPWEHFTIWADDHDDMLNPVGTPVPSGRLIVAVQRKSADGDQLCVTSSDKHAQTWTPPCVISRIEAGWELLPTGMGRFTSGRLVLCAVGRKVKAGWIEQEVHSPEGVPRYRIGGFQIETKPQIYTSDDDGATWTGGAIAAVRDLVTLTPCGHPLEVDGTVHLLAHGPANDSEMGRNLSSLGYLCSEDDGETWRYCSTIVQADIEQMLSYGSADWVRLPDGVLTAFIEVNDRSRGPSVHPCIARCISTNSGRTWSEPVKTLVGPRPSVVVLPSGSILCATSDDEGVQAAMSHDGGHRWSALLYVRNVIHYRPGKRGGIWLAQPAADGIFGVYHWMHGRRAHATELQGFFLRPMQTKWPPAWQDRSYRASNPPVATGRWQQAESRIVRPNAPQANAGLVYQSLVPVEDDLWLGVGMGTPPDAQTDGTKMPAYQDGCVAMGVFLMEAPRLEGPWRVIRKVPYERQFPHLWTGLGLLRSGRTLVFTVDSNEGDVKTTTRSLPGAPRGHQWQETIFEGDFIRFANGTSISNNGGKTWSVHYPAGKAVTVQGKKPACLLFDRGHPIELEDGTLVRPCQAWLSEVHQRRGLISAIVVRSTDGGKSWLAPSLIAEADVEEAIVWREPNIAVLTDGRWFVVLRAESFKWGRNKTDIFVSAFVSWSSDLGYTWTKPRPLTLGAEAEAQVLPDGTLFIGTRKFNRSYYWLSDDGGETFFHQETIYDGPELAPGRSDIVGTPRPVVLNEDTVLIVTDAPGPQVMSSGPILVRHLRRRR